MAKWTLENGRRIFKDGKFAFRVDHSYKGASCLSHSEADKLAHHITRLLNADENHPIIDENATCALINEDDPIVCPRCGLSEGEGTCPLEDIALDRF